MPATATGGIRRGCGSREAGGVYVECGLSDKGIDISNFISDPVPRFEIQTKRGQEVRERNGTYHLFDHVGKAHYPTAADIFEEVRRHGASRRTSPNQQFELLGPDSRLILVHPRAYPLPVKALAKIERKLGLQNMPSHRQHCMLYRKTQGENTTHFEHGGDHPPRCTRFWWLDAGWERPVNRSSPAEEDGEGNLESPEYVGGLKFPYPVGEDGRRYVKQGTRSIGDTGFRTHGGPLEESRGETGPVDAAFKSGIAFSLPITAISVVDSDDETADERLDDIRSRSTIPVTKQPE